MSGSIVKGIISIKCPREIRIFEIYKARIKEENKKKFILLTQKEKKINVTQR